MIQVTSGRLVECNGVQVVTVNWRLQSAHSCSAGREVRPSARNRQTWNEPQNGQKGRLGQISVSRKPRAVSGSQKLAATSRTLGMSHKASIGLWFIVMPPVSPPTAGSLERTPVVACHPSIPDSRVFLGRHDCAAMREKL